MAWELAHALLFVLEEHVRDRRGWLIADRHPPVRMRADRLGLELEEAIANRPVGAGDQD